MPDPRHLARLLICAPALVFAALVFATPALAAPEELVLKERIDVHEDTVTLGDLFENVGAARAIAVFRSPDLGTEGFVAASRVNRAAAAHGLSWHNRGAIEEIIVRRPARVISLEKITDLIRAAVAREVNGGDISTVELRFTGAPKALQIDARRRAPLVIKNLTLPEGSGQFDAMVGFEDGAGPQDGYRYRGRVLETVETLVPRRTIARGEIIGASDIRTLRVQKRRALAGRVSAPEKLIGMAAKRRLNAGRQVRGSDVERPRIVRRNDTVTIAYRVHGLVLQAQGRALEDGAKGSTITVRNMRSRQIVEAQVAGPKRVTVAATAGRTISPRAPAAAGHAVR